MERLRTGRSPFLRKTMRCLLLNPPGSRLYARDKFCSGISKAAYYWPQVDLLMLSGILSARHQVSVIDAIVEALDPHTCIERIVEAQYDAVLALTSIASWPEDFGFLEALKSRMPGIKIIVIGGFLLVSAAEVLKAKPFLDAALLDFTSPHILDYLEGRRPVKDMVYREGGDIISGAREKTGRFSVPVPRHELFPLDKYRFPLCRHKRFTVTLASLGCPYSCAFCMPALIHFKLRKPSNVIEELAYIKSLGIREVIFQDPTFSAVRDHALALCQGMIDAKLDLSWMCQTRCDCVDHELLEQMKQAGMYGIEFGVETSSESGWKTMNKGIDRNVIMKAFDACRRLGIRASAFFIIGMPDDDEASILDKIAFARELNPDAVAFSLFMPHPGTPLGKQMGVHGWTEGLTFDDVTPRPIQSAGMTEERLGELLQKAYRDFYFRPSYILRRLTRITSMAELGNNIRAFFSLLKMH